MNVKAGDTSPIQWHANADLTNATVRLIARQPGGPSVVLAAKVTDGPGGLVTHILTGDLEAGDYLIELEVDTGDEIATFPNDGYAFLSVQADLD